MRGGALAPVQAATAVNKAVPRYLSGLGTITAANTVTVRSRVDGQLMAIHFREGQQVKAGDLLAEIDPSQFKGAGAGATRERQSHPRQCPPRFSPLSAVGKTNLVSRQSWIPSNLWSVNLRAPSRPTKPRSPAPSSSSTGAGSPRRLTAAWA